MSMVFPRRGSGAHLVRWLSELLPRRRRKVKTAAVPADRRDAAARQRGVSRAAGYGGLRRVAHVVPVADGHMSRADGTMELPDDETYGGLIKNVSTGLRHEQRLCFPLDSVRRANGKYPPCAREVVYRGCTRISVEDIRRGSGKANGEMMFIAISIVLQTILFQELSSCRGPSGKYLSSLPVDFKRWMAGENA